MNVEEIETIFSQFCLQNVTIVWNGTDYSDTVLHEHCKTNGVHCESMHSETVINYWEVLFIYIYINFSYSLDPTYRII